MIEAMRRAYCDRARWLGDGDFVEIPPQLTTKEYARSWPARSTCRGHAERIARGRHPAGGGVVRDHAFLGGRSRRHGGGQHLYPGELFGCRVVVRGAGFLLNNEMTDFNRVPGRTDRRA